MEVDEGGGPEPLSSTPAPPGDSAGTMAAERGDRDETTRRKADDVAGESVEKDGREEGRRTEEAADSDDRERSERRDRTSERGREEDGSRSRETPRGSPEQGRERGWDGDRRDREVCLRTCMYAGGLGACITMGHACIWCVVCG